MFRNMLIAGGLLLGGQASAADDPVIGFWMVESGRAIVEVEPCGASVCGEIVWLIEPLDAAGAPKTDLNNVDETLRDRPVCGLSLIRGFKQDGPGEWSGGEIYNGEDGETYTAYLEMQSDGKLKVRGYVGVPILGKSQIWTREANDRGGC